jgi:hypothetical protein
MITTYFPLAVQPCLMAVNSTTTLAQDASCTGHINNAQAAINSRVAAVRNNALNMSHPTQEHTA